MKKKIAVAMASLMVAITVNATPAPEITVENGINITQRMRITPEGQNVVLSIDLGPGTWTANANLNLFARAQEGTKIFYASYLSLTPEVDYHNARIAFGSQDATGANRDPQALGRVDTPVPLVGRRIVIVTPPGTTKRVYLIAWVHTLPGQSIYEAYVYGFAHADRLINQP